MIQLVWYKKIFLHWLDEKNILSTATTTIFVHLRLYLLVTLLVGHVSSSSLWSVSLCCSKSIPWLHLVKILCWKREASIPPQFYIPRFNICKFHTTNLLLKLGQTAAGVKAPSLSQNCQLHPANWYPNVSLDISIDTKFYVNLLLNHKLGQTAMSAK